MSNTYNEKIKIRLLENNTRKCTMCDKIFDIWDEQEDLCFEKKMGYGTRYDGEIIRFNLCCECFENVVNMLAPLCKNNFIEVN